MTAKNPFEQITKQVYDDISQMRAHLRRLPMIAAAEERHHLIKRLEAEAIDMGRLAQKYLKYIKKLEQTT